MRFLFLIAISNGYVIYLLFLFNQTKYIIGFLFLFVLRREIQFRIENIKKDIKFYLINYGLFLLAASAAPYFFPLFLIYLFHDISKDELFKKENIKLDILQKYIKYNSIYIFTLVINLSILFVLVEFFYVWYILAEFIAILCCFLINFFANKSLTFNMRDVENNL